MFISQTAKTAIKSLVFIASGMKDADCVTVSEITEGIDESEHTIRKVLQQLVKHGMANSSQGKNGGFYVSHQQLSTSIMKVVELFDGSEHIRGCVLGLHKCSEKFPCPLHHDFENVRKNILKILKTRTIGDLSESTVNELTFLTH